jgi:hypothetical protein
LLDPKSVDSLEDSGELTSAQIEANFRSLSLRELSFEAAQLAVTLEDPDDFLTQLQQYLAEATEAKVDGYVLFKEYK